jgi:hypothetical protein
MPTGCHYDLLYYDDVVVDNLVNSLNMIKKTTGIWYVSLNFGKDGGKIIILGTRYHQLDTYETIIEKDSSRPE